MEKYSVKVKCAIMGLFLFWAFTANLLVNPANASPGIGYWIIVEGAHFYFMHSTVTMGCQNVYQTLKGVGYDASDRIMYLDDATSDSIVGAIQWAASRVTADEPLWFYMFSHGDDDTFTLARPENITYSWLNTQINTYIPSEVKTCIIIAACYSGSAIGDFNRNGRIIMTSCNDSEPSQTYNYISFYWEAFSKPFWDAAKDHDNSVMDCFNIANYSIHYEQRHAPDAPPQSPQLDQAGWDASTVYIGSHDYVPSVGGFWEPVDKLGVVLPYILTVAFATAAMACIICFVYVRHARHRRKQQ